MIVFISFMSLDYANLLLSFLSILKVAKSCSS